MNELVAVWLPVLLRTTLFLAAAAILVQLLLRFGRPATWRVHRIAWLLVLVQGWFWWQVPLRIPVAPPARPATAPVVTETGGASPVDMPRLSKVVEPVRPALAASERSRPLSDFVPGVLFTLWLAGMVALAGSSLWGYGRFLRQLHGTVPCDPEWTRQWDELCQRQGVTRPPTLCVSEKIGPLLCRTPRGYRLVVPAALWQRLTPGQRQSILRHELAHLRRRDLLKSLLVRLLLLPHWFNPWAWLAAARFDEAAEWACDEAAQGATTHEGGQYAQALLQLDAVLGQDASYQMAAWGHGLSTRISRLLNPRVKEDSLMKRLMVFGTALGLTLVCLFRVSLVAQEPASPATPVEASGPASEAAVNPFHVMPQDSKLREGQRAYRDWDADTFGVPDATKWQRLTAQERSAAEEKYLQQLSSTKERERVEAIDALVGLGCKQAVPGILKIAAERREKNNWDRHTATRALGMLGDLSVVPDLVHLTYHFNWNVRQWAQISLTRLTGETYGRDLAAWARWWKEQGHTPAISEERIAWASSPECLQYADPQKQEEMDRKMEAQLLQERAQQRATVHPRDSKLNGIQRAMRNATEEDLAYRLDPSRWENLSPEEQAKEEAYWLKQLSSESYGARNLAIYVLTVLKSKKAIPGLLAIATERVEKDNADRSYACRALGIVGDLSIVPELVPLIYHYNRDTRLWAQISLVRLTGENFGRDVAAWARWWKEQGHTPPISEEPVAWATSPDTLQYADPKAQEECDQQLLLVNPEPSPAWQEQVDTAHQRMQQDQTRFSQEALAEMESLTRIADDNFGSQAAWDAMKTLVEKYPKSNRMGCSLLYLGQMNKDGKVLDYLKQAIDEYSDCYYGDGVQVGAFARFTLGKVYWDRGRRDEAKKLFEELRRDYPKAIGHNGQPLAEQLPRD